MRCLQIASWLACALLSAFPAITISLPSGRTPCNRAHLAAAPPNSAKSPIEDIHRVALMIPPGSDDPVVVAAIELERSTYSKKRRSGLFGPKPVITPEKTAPSKRPGHNSSSQRGASGSRPEQSASPASTANPYTTKQQTDIAEALLLDSLVERLAKNLNVQVVPQTETWQALKELNLSMTSAPSGSALSTLCDKLNCDAVLVPKIAHMRTRTAQTRAVVVWATIELSRPSGASGTTADSSDSRAQTVRYAAAGASASERAPFQDRFMKDWLQLTLEASRATAANCAKSLQTGIEAPLSRYGDRVAVTPVHAPSQADALLFYSGGRTVAPGSIQHLSTDVSSYFHPDVLPVLPDSAISGASVVKTIAAMDRDDEQLWTADERPSAQHAAELGRRLKVQYVLMARVSDLELALLHTPRAGAGARSADNPTDGLTADSATRDTATAEALGAFVRVSDGAILWNERTTATMTGQQDGADIEKSRRKMAVDAVRFSLLQLERRFRQYRLRFE